MYLNLELKPLRKPLLHISKRKQEDNTTIDFKEISCECMPGSETVRFQY
jgi:hypothetical protein